MHNWETGTPYPLISTNTTVNPGNTVVLDYAVGASAPVPYIVCPDRTVRTTIQYFSAPGCNVFPSQLMADMIAHCPASTTGINKVIANNSEIKIFPNPSDGNASVEFNLKQSEKVKIIITNLLGATVYESTEKSYYAGDQLINLKCENLNNGIYFIHVKVGDKIYQNNLSIIK